MTVPPRRPLEQLPPLAPGAVRRLVRLDVLRTPGQDVPDAHPGGRTVEATAQDLLGTEHGTEVLDSAHVRVEVDPAGRVAALHSTPAAPLDGVVGVPVHGGLRAAARAALAGTDDDSGSAPLAALLDDVPVAVLVSGYLDVRAGRLGEATDDLLRDVCAGWRSDGEAFATTRRTGRAHTGGTATVADGRLGQEAPALPADALRRSRWITVTREGAGGRVAAGFRDSCREADGAEGVLHEYTLTARLDTSGAVHDVRPEPRVLPFSECLLAVPEVVALEGEPAGDLRRRVPRLLPGTRGCTHLNDLLRALSCTPRLLAAVPPRAFG